MQKKARGMGFCRLSCVRIRFRYAHVAQLAEHVLGKDEVISSILIMGSNLVKKLKYIKENNHQEIK